MRDQGRNLKVLAFGKDNGKTERNYLLIGLAQHVIEHDKVFRKICRGVFTEVLSEGDKMPHVVLNGATCPRVCLSTLLAGNSFFLFPNK